MPSYYSYYNWYTSDPSAAAGTGTDIADPGPPVVLESYPYWDGFAWTQQIYTLPAVSIPSTPTRYITKLAFRQRFTNAERVAIEIAALDNASATQVERETAAAIRSYMKDVEVSNYIDLDRTDLQAGVNFLASIGLLSPERVDEIILGDILDSER